MYIKRHTYLRNTIGQERLTEIALFNFYRDTVVDPLQIVKKQAKHKTTTKFTCIIFNNSNNNT